MIFLISSLIFVQPLAHVIIIKKSERYWDDDIYHPRSAMKNRIMEEMKNVAETYKSSETHTSYNTQCMT
jgi:hypothetical protein